MRRRRSRPKIFETLDSLKAVRLEEATYARLLERADVKKALHRFTVAQAVRDSVSRKLCIGGALPYVTVDLLSCWEAELAEAKAHLVNLAGQEPLLMKHPVLAEQ